MKRTERKRKIVEFAMKRYPKSTKMDDGGVQALYDRYTACHEYTLSLAGFPEKLRANMVSQKDKLDSTVLLYPATVTVV